jgi:hypothetical protein
MSGDLLKYAGTDNLNDGKSNNWGDVSERDFQYTPIANSGSVFFGADDNIMLNYGNSNGKVSAYNGKGNYNVTLAPAPLNKETLKSHYYNTSWKNGIDAATATFNVNTDGYLLYKNSDPVRNYHKMYRGCNVDNKARDLKFDFEAAGSGGLGIVATNYIDLFTNFIYKGGSGSGIITNAPGMANLHGENIMGYGLYIKSQDNGDDNLNKP